MKAKLLPLPDQKRSLLATMQAFNDACNFVSQSAWKEKHFGQIFLHHLCYYPVRKQFGLTAQLAVRVIGKVAESYRSEKNHLHVFKKYSAVVYDQRILSFKDLDSVSITTLGGRFKIPIVFGEYARLDQRHIRGQADLIYVKGNFYLCLVTEIPDSIPITPKGFLGVDMGIEYIATSSDGELFSGKSVDAVRSRITRLKAVLQKRNTKSAKRHLKKISGREARFKRTINHVISKRLVSVAKDTERGIAVEDLHGFRKTVRKAQRERFGKWAFGQLRRFIEYKAKLAGIPVSAVNPGHTSQRCSRCGHTARCNRKAQSIFSCIQCGFSLHADLNAAKNIALRADVNRPIAVHLESLTSPSPGTAMPHRSAVG
jgi:putative transposase